MGNIKAFFKKDSDLLRNSIMLLIVVPIGLNKLICFQSLGSTIFGLLVMIASILIFVDIIKEFKRITNN